MPAKTNRISFQGEPGANSDTACRNVYPEMEPLPCPTFEDAFNAVETGKADLAMIPIENTIAGRVADIHHLLPELRLHIVGEYFLPIHFQLMVLTGVAGSRRSRPCYSHIHALGPVPQIHSPAIGWKAVVAGDTAGAAKHGSGDRRPLAWPRWRRGWRPISTVSTSSQRTSRTPKTTSPASSCCPGTSSGSSAGRRTDDDDHFHLPGAQHSGRALQGDGRVCHQRRQHDQAGELPARRQVHSTQFYADIEGHPDDPSVKKALEGAALLFEARCAFSASTRAARRARNGTSPTDPPVAFQVFRAERLHVRPRTLDRLPTVGL